MKGSLPIVCIVPLLLLASCSKPQHILKNEQDKEQAIPGPPPFARIKSPEFNADGTLTFRIWAPQATKVELQCDALLGDQSNLLKRFDEEYWRITIQPAASGLFYYKFLVDGVQTPDPLNAMTSGNSSIILIEGEATKFFQSRDVPHGVIHRHLYHNPAIEAIRSCHVYTPPGYQDDTIKKFPVLFLFHGSGETDESWFREGKAHTILDNLFAARKAIPMIVVTPYGHTVEPGTHEWPFVQEQGDFIQDFKEVLLPFITSEYRISDQPDDWALAGFSMGGYHALMIGLNQLDQFGNIGIFSWGGNGEFFSENIPDVLEDPGKVNEHVRTFFMACGKKDFLIRNVATMDSLLTHAGIEHTYVVSDGGHDMTNWRKYLYQFVQQIFRE